MKLIVGLGNAGPQYDGTRHNIGFYMLDRLVEDGGYQFKMQPKFHGATAELQVGDEKVLLLKSAIFYNQTGQSVRAVMDFYKLESRDILAIHDELALPFGTVRTRVGGSDAGNNGIKSISSHVGQTYGRIRIGIYNELRDRIDDSDFVLAKFTSTERTLLPNVADEVKEAVLQFITDKDFGATTKRIKNQ